MRAFLADNPGKTRHDALCCWKPKSAQRGSHAYEPSDLDLVSAHDEARPTP